jgi:hypothetical protein
VVQHVLADHPDGGGVDAGLLGGLAQGGLDGGLVGVPGAAGDAPGAAVVAPRRAVLQQDGGGAVGGPGAQQEQA